MSVSQIEICNFAIQEIGGESIISLSDETVEAEQCNLRYDSARSSLLETHLWNFAMTRASLPLSSSVPAFGYEKQFTLPSDCLRVVATYKELDDSLGLDPYYNGFKTISFQQSFASKDSYKIEGKSLLYNENVCKILYIRDEKDTTTFSPLFADMLGVYLASKIAYKITGSKSLEAQLLKKYERMGDAARFSDSQQGTTERQTTSSFLASRY